MNRVLLAAVLTVVLALSLTGTAAAQSDEGGSVRVPGRVTAPGGEGAEVCVNTSDQAEARRLFPKATIHVIPDSPDPLMNGWAVVYGGNKRMSDAEEIELRQQARQQLGQGARDE